MNLVSQKNPKIIHQLLLNIVEKLITTKVLNKTFQSHVQDLYETP